MNNQQPMEKRPALLAVEVAEPCALHQVQQFESVLADFRIPKQDKEQDARLRRHQDAAVHPSTHQVQELAAQC